MKALLHSMSLFLLLIPALLLCACGRAPEPTPEPLPTPAPTVAVSAEEGAVFYGSDGELRAVVSPALLQSEQAGQLRVSYRVSNRSAVKLTRLRFTLRCLDAAGETIQDDLAVTFSLEAAPLEAGETREIPRIHYFTGAENTASVLVTPLSAENERELAPWLEPVPDSPLATFCNDAVLSARLAALDAEAPVKLLYQPDQEAPVEITDPAAIRATAEKLAALHIGSLAGRNVDDGGFTFTFLMADGTSWSLRFDFKTLFFWHGQNYEVTEPEVLQAIVEEIE